MSFFSKLFGGGTKKSKKPCDNCSSECKYCPGCCDECKPYKDALADWLYTVDHLNEYYTKYVVVNDEIDVGTVNCPACNAANPSYNAKCDFCGTALREGNGKIPVKSARDIPDPIVEAQNIIFDRDELIREYASSDDEVVDAIAGLFGKGEDDDRLGDKMSVSEIKAAASSLGVSVSEYLQGLDNGVYPPYSALKNRASSRSAVRTSPVGRPVAPRCPPVMPPRPPMGRGMPDRSHRTPYGRGKRR